MPAGVQPPPVTSDEHLRETPAERPFRAVGVENRFVASVENDDIVRCITACRDECDERGIDYRVLDEAIGAVAERLDKRPHDFANPCGYLRNAVRCNAQRLRGAA